MSDPIHKAHEDNKASNQRKALRTGVGLGLIGVLLGTSGRYVCENADKIEPIKWAYKYADAKTSENDLEAAKNLKTMLIRLRDVPDFAELDVQLANYYKDLSKESRWPETKVTMGTIVLSPGISDRFLTPIDNALGDRNEPEKFHFIDLLQSIKNLAESDSSVTRLMYVNIKSAPPGAGLSTIMLRFLAEAEAMAEINSSKAPSRF